MHTSDDETFENIAHSIFGGFFCAAYGGIALLRPRMGFVDRVDVPNATDASGVVAFGWSMPVLACGDIAYRPGILFDCVPAWRDTRCGGTHRQVGSP